MQGKVIVLSPVSSHSTALIKNAIYDMCFFRRQDTYAKFAEVRTRLGFLFRSRCILPVDIKSR